MKKEYMVTYLLEHPSYTVKANSIEEAQDLADILLQKDDFRYNEVMGIDIMEEGKDY